jgi:hypothetical protein
MALRRKYLIARIKAIGFGLAIWAFITGLLHHAFQIMGIKRNSNPISAPI